MDIPDTIYGLSRWIAPTHIWTLPVDSPDTIYGLSRWIAPTHIWTLPVDSPDTYMDSPGAELHGHFNEK